MGVYWMEVWTDPIQYRVIMWIGHKLLGQVANELYNNKRDALKRCRELRLIVSKERDNEP